MIELKTKELRRMEKDLKLFNSRALPYATRQAVNATAWAARRAWQGEIDERLTTRNKWTRQSIRVQQTRTLDIRRQESVVGSLEPYMERQEFGGTVTADGREGHPIATSYSAGQGQSARPRTRLPKRPNKMRNIQLRNSRLRAGNRAQRNIMAVKQAAASGQRFVWMDLGRRQGIFRVMGTERAPRVKMVWDLSRRSVRTPATPTLAPALVGIDRKATVLYRKALRFQLKRHKILGY